MNIRKVLFYGILVLIVILLIFNLKVNSLGNDLKAACVNNYTEYLINKTCPCLTPLNLQNGLNLSFLKNISALP